MDFETYSEAGYVFTDRWRGVAASKSGISAVGSAAYAEHPTTEVLCLAYDLKDGEGARLWTPGNPDPVDLFTHLCCGGLMSAWNAFFEYCIWGYVCAGRMGWPAFPAAQLRCDMSKAYAFSLPGKLKKAAMVLGTSEQKDKGGKLLIRKLCAPRTPTKHDARMRRTIFTHPHEFMDLYNYCKQDVRAEKSISGLIPDLTPIETKTWLLDQKINSKGVAIDTQGVDNCISIVNAAFEKYNREFRDITGCSASEIQRFKKWLSTQGIEVKSLDKPSVLSLLEREGLPVNVKRALEIRQSLGSSSVKKLFSIKNRLNTDGRLRGLFQYHGADRTGRWSGRGPQPQNLPASGPVDQWGIEQVDHALQLIATGSLTAVENIYGDAVKTAAGCLRGLFQAAPGHELICSDYSAIEAVVLAMLAGEQWRIDVFKTHGMIYEMSAAKITGVPFQEFVDHKKNTGEHHPHRKKIGKVSELASGFGGSVGAWKAFGADKFMTDEEILKNVWAWREASPKIVDFWRGLENAAFSAVSAPGNWYAFKGIYYICRENVLYCRLLSGRYLTYHEPRIIPLLKPWGKELLSLTYMGWSVSGWNRMDTYGGKLCENVVQATARDLLAHGLLGLDAAGYDIVLHVHDEIVAEVPEGGGCIDEFEKIMGNMPAWASGWHIKAAGGWRGKRYRKE